MSTVAIKGRRSPTVAMHLAREPTDEALRAIIQDCAGDQVDFQGQPVPPDNDWLYQRAKAQWPSMSFNSPRGFGNSSITQLALTLYAPPSTQLSTGRTIEFPETMRGSRLWAFFKANYSHVHHTESAEMGWFLSKARHALVPLEPEFAFADVDTAIYKNVAQGAWERAWPLMVFGPERVKKIGRDVLLDAPAWKVEELPYGGIWVQAWENPFDAPQKQVTTLADYLGLTARGG